MVRIVAIPLISPESSSIKTLINKFANLNLTQHFKYLASSSSTQYYKLGTLTLPQGGHQAIIQVNLCYAYNFNPGNITNVSQWYLQNYQLNINLYSGNGKMLNGALVGASRAVDPGSGGTNTAIYTAGGIFHNGYVVVSTPFTTPLTVLLGLTTDSLNTVDVWIQSYPLHGVPLVQVTQTAGYFTRAFPVPFASMPLWGWTMLDIYSNTLTQIYKNLYNGS